MKKVLAIVVLWTTLVALVPAPARAGAATDAALALGAFAVFSQLWGWPRGYWGDPVVVVRPYDYYSPYYSPYYSHSPYYLPYYVPPSTWATPPPPSPAVQREVVYPHGRHVLRGDGVTEAYQWVWIPNPPPPPPPPPPPEKQ